MTEKRSDYTNIVIIGISDMIESLVESLNNLINWIFVILPWLVAAGILWLIVRFIRKRKK